MAMEELIAYVVLLSLPLWLLVEQLLFIRMTRARMVGKETVPSREPEGGPEAWHRAPPGLLTGLLGARSGPAKGDMVRPTPGRRGDGAAPRAGGGPRHADHHARRHHSGF